MTGSTSWRGSSDPSDDIVSLNDVVSAATTLGGVAHRTPLLTSRTLNRIAECDVFLKCENLQRTGSFKFRGAYACLAQLKKNRGLTGGVIAYSSGNHGQGVALAAHLLGTSATIVMPEDAPAIKLNAVRGYGATVVLHGTTEPERRKRALELARERDATIVTPCDDPLVIAGQGTVALEILQETQDLDALLVPTSSGGLLAGCVVAATALRPAIRVYGVEPDTSDDYARSLACGALVEVPPPATIADGLGSSIPADVPFRTVQRLCAGIVVVTDDELRTAMHFAFERLKLVIEPSGAAGLAALLAKKLPTDARRVGVVISGGNVDPARYAESLAASRS